MASRRPYVWWIPPFLGRIPEDLQERHLRLLGAVSLALFFEEYDMSVLTSALMQIAEELRMPVDRIGLDLALIRMGAIAAILVIPFSDRIGRRPVFIGCVAAMGVLTFGTAFAQTPTQFVWLQALTRTFFVAGSAIAFVIVTEEFPAGHRGWGLGMLAALGAVGHGAGALAFSQIDRLPYGWRALYAVGVIPVLMMPFFLRRIPETQRFEAERSSLRGEGLRANLQPLVELGRKYPGRAAGMALVGFAVAAAILPSFQYSGLYVQGALGWKPADYATMVIVGGGVGIIGNVVAGRLGDRFGRKRTGFVLLAIFPAASMAYYHGTSSIVFASWTALVFTSMGGRIILRALATELFPTSQRGAASGMYAVMETLGAVAGLLFTFAYGTENVDDIGFITPLVALCVYVGALIVLTFPETRQRELEEIS